MFAVSWCSSSPPAVSMLGGRVCDGSSFVRVAGAPASRLLDRLRDAIRVRHCSPRIGKAHVEWVVRFVLFRESCGCFHWGRRSTSQSGPILSGLEAVDDRNTRSSEKEMPIPPAECSFEPLLAASAASHRPRRPLFPATPEPEEPLFMPGVTRPQRVASLAADLDC